MKSIFSLPPVLQEVWSRVYAAGVSGELSRYSIDSETSTPSDESIAAWAENHAWEAVRRANGGEMPNEQEREEGKCAVTVTRPAEEPTDEEMVEALSPIVAELSNDAVTWAHNKPFHGAWIHEARLCMLGQPSTWTREFRSQCAIALASWKVARARGRK